MDLDLKVRGLGDFTLTSILLVSLGAYQLAGCAAGPIDDDAATPLESSDTFQSTQTQKPPVSEPSAEPQADEATEQPQEPVAEPEPPPATTAAPPADTNGKLPDWLHGSFAARYRGRFSGDGDKDHTVGGYLALDAVDPDNATLRGHVEARVDIDLEGDDEGEVFGDLSDTYDSAIVPKLYQAYGEFGFDPDPALSNGSVRIGRQLDARLPEFVRFDGASAVTKSKGKSELEFGAYGGVPVHLHESDTDSGRVYGVFLEGLAWKDGFARFDWLHLEDDLVLEEHRDDLLAIALRQKVTDRVRVEGEYSHLESDPRDLRLRGFYEDADTQTIVRASYYQLLETQTANANEIDPFFEQLFEYFPFRQATFSVSRGVGENSTVDVGFDMRRVADNDDIGDYNRDWERYYATFTQSDVFEPGIAISITADLWDDDDRDTNSFGADVSYAPEEQWETAIGTYYSLYKYSFLEFEERDDVRTYYVRASYELSSGLDLDVRYEYEDDDFDTYHTLRLGALWRF